MFLRLKQSNKSSLCLQRKLKHKIYCEYVIVDNFIFFNCFKIHIFTPSSKQKLIKNSKS